LDIGALQQGIQQLSRRQPAILLPFQRRFDHVLKEILQRVNRDAAVDAHGSYVFIGDPTDIFKGWFSIVFQNLDKELAPVGIVQVAAR